MGAFSSAFSSAFDLVVPSLEFEGVRWPVVTIRDSVRVTPTIVDSVRVTPTLSR